MPFKWFVNALILTFLESHVTIHFFKPLVVFLIQILPFMVIAIEILPLVRQNAVMAGTLRTILTFAKNKLWANGCIWVVPMNVFWSKEWVTECKLIKKWNNYTEKQPGDFIIILLCYYPAKTVISPRSSPLGDASRGETMFFLSKRPKRRGARSSQATILGPSCRFIKINK